jgi:PTS system nitrogen regulatory IIA component
MHNVEKDIQLDLVIPDLKANNRKHAFQILSQEIGAFIPCHPSSLMDGLCQAELNAGSGIGDGVAIPHLKVKHLYRPFTALAKLSQPIKFDSIDHKPVDLIYCLLSPEQDGPLHLRRLSRITRTMKNRELCDTLRSTDDADIIRSLLLSPEGWMLAA